MILRVFPIYDKSSARFITADSVCIDLELHLKVITAIQIAVLTRNIAVRYFPPKVQWFSKADHAAKFLFMYIQKHIWEDDLQ